MKKEDVWISFDANDEEPDCMRCIHVDGDDRFCKNCCGPEHGWNGYLREEKLDGEFFRALAAKLAEPAKTVSE